MDIILLFFIARYIGNVALRKGQKRWTWIIYTVVAWMAAEFIGMAIAVMGLGYKDIMPIALFALFCALGGALLVHGLLSRVPDLPADDRERDPQDLL